MSRLGAAALAVVAGLMTFGLAMLAVHWLPGAMVLAGALTSHWFPADFVVWISIAMSFVAIVLAIRQKRPDKAEEGNSRDLPSASERLRRVVQHRD